MISAFRLSGMGTGFHLPGIEKDSKFVSRRHVFTVTSGLPPFFYVFDRCFEAAQRAQADRSSAAAVVRRWPCHGPTIHAFHAFINCDLFVCLIGCGGL